MASNFERMHDSETGQDFIRPLGTDQLIPVSEEDKRQLEEGGLEAFLGAAVGAGEGIIRGADRIIGGALGNAPDPRLEQLQREQEMRSLGAPVASALGQAVPDVALSAGTGFTGSLARRAGVTALGEGALGAARTPDAPLEGAAIGAAIGGGLPIAGAGIARGYRMAESILGQASKLGAMSDARAALAERIGLRGRERAVEAGPSRSGGGEPSAAGGVLSGDLSAAAARNPSLGQGSRRVLHQAADSETMLDRYSFPLTRTQARMLDETDADAFAQLRAADAAEEVASRSQPTMIGAIRDLAKGEERLDFQQLRRQQQQAVNRAFNAELGMPDEGAAVSRGSVGKRMRELGDQMDAIVAEHAQPVGYRETMDGLRLNDIIERNGLAGAQEAEVMRQVEERLGGKFHPDRTGRVEISGEDLAEVINAIGKRADGFLKNVETLSVGRALNEVRTRLTRMMQRDWDREAVEDYTGAQRQWAIAKDLVRGGNNLSARGDVNLRSYMQSYRTGDALYRTGRRGGDWESFLDAASAAMFKEVPDSGTPTGAAVIADRLLGMVPGAGLLR